MALNDGKTLKLLSGKEKSSRLCTSLSIDRENLFQFFLTFFKNAIRLCTCYKCPYKFSFLVNAFVFPLSCLLYGKYFFQASRSIANKRYEWQVTKSTFTSGKSSIAAMNLLAQIICSDPIILFAFVIMQVVLLNIFVGQR